MIYRKRRYRGRMPYGFFRFEDGKGNAVSGFGDGDFVRLRDEFGQIWTGTAERMGDDTVRFRFRDSSGNVISGITDGLGILLRDDRGNTWRGYVY